MFYVSEKVGRKMFLFNIQWKLFKQIFSGHVEAAETSCKHN